MTSPTPTPSALTQEQMKQLEAKIREACPHSMACQLREVGPVDLCIYCEGCDTEECTVGRPLELADIMMFLESLFDKAARAGMDTAKTCHVDTRGRITFGAYKSVQWNLKENFHSQRPEVHVFLYSLIV